MRPRLIAAAIALLALGALQVLPVLGQAPPKPWSPPGQPQIPANGAYLPDSTVMIRVAGDPVRAGEIVYAYFDAFRANVPPDDSVGRVQYLQTFVNQRLLARLAHEVNPPLDFTARARLREQEDRVLSNALYLRQVEDSVRVDTSEVRKLYWSTTTERRLRLMTIADKSTAEKVRAALVGHRMT
ncbi:MAG TPA: hypothetical protein VLV15_15340, partial [Dongiaceae bacterium]|nr:hypothetical protein [Dongiaceae bacterium]